MKTIMTVVIGTLALAPWLFAQQQAQPKDQVLGRGRGGAPFAWNDKDKDGICDITGRPVGQNRPIGWFRGAGAAGAARPMAWGDRDKDGICDFTGRPVGQGRGRAGGRGRMGARNWGRGMGRTFTATPQVAQPAP
jgi:hypothetical protein